MSDSYYYYCDEEKLDITQKHTIISQEEIRGVNIVYIKSDINVKGVVNTFITTINSQNNKNDIETETFNKLVNYRVSLKFTGTTNIEKSQYWVISKFNELDERKGWQEDVSKFPTMDDHNDGLIKMIGKNGYKIYTKGVNEFL